jgi:beta-lactamase regulating signal transducer with metallopeptidase domain
MLSDLVSNIAESVALDSRSETSMRTLTSFFGVLMLIALIIRLIWWILGAAVLVVLFYVVRAQLRASRARAEADARRAAQIAARADQQHRWILRGDERGIYGEYPVADLFRERC